MARYPCPKRRASLTSPADNTKKEKVRRRKSASIIEKTSLGVCFWG